MLFWLLFCDALLVCFLLFSVRCGFHFGVNIRLSKARSELVLWVGVFIAFFPRCGLVTLIPPRGAALSTSYPEPVYLYSTLLGNSVASGCGSACY
ncbi:hypothetical protein N658DRAFT_331222 [Parathielavia hyrcaniae]|uniref:Uncharacterized protein n=1 Tax=Parathielavia hyrcaniae TaxID=113614 RepID=A0AAN6Q3N8_9PEZI|nr:hypothetical protein N658DRAFT_331222 [Parathielavia hyrcaniae]